MMALRAAQAVKAKAEKEADAVSAATAAVRDQIESREAELRKVEAVSEQAATALRSLQVTMPKAPVLRTDSGWLG